MPQTVEEKRAYAKGYNRANSNHWDRMRRLCDIAKGYRKRLTDTTTERVCATCDRWKRGGPQCLWGLCRADFDYGTEPRMWVDTTDRNGAAIATTEDFGCPCWLPRDPQ